jgi:hypothetical protein
MASTTEVGMLCRRMSQGPFWPAARPATAVVDPIGVASPSPGLNRFTRTRLTTKATAVVIWKYTIAFAPIRPVVFKSPLAPMPTTRVENRSGAMIILIRRRNASASGRIATANSGKKEPTPTPTSSPMKICVVTFGRRRRRNGTARPGASGGITPSPARTRRSR